MRWWRRTSASLINRELAQRASAPLHSSAKHDERTRPVTFLRSAPDPADMAPRLLENAVRFVPALRGARILQQRVCARPQSPDGRPFLGPLADLPGVFVAAGHGPWGMSTGPATAQLVVAAILDGAAVPAGLEADRAI